MAMRTKTNDRRDTSNSLDKTALQPSQHPARRTSTLVAAAAMTSGAPHRRRRLRRRTGSSRQPASGRKPNILVILGDDIGQTNISAYSFGLMGYRTPNIDRIASEGMMFTDYYAEQSCTAGRSSFITGQATLRTGLSKVGLPGATVGLQTRTSTIAEVLKPLGYATGQFGKNHLGDRNEFLPTVHGFDEFFGNLYHLNAEEEPEQPPIRKDPAFTDVWPARRAAMQGDRPRRRDGRSALRQVGKQTIEDTGAADQEADGDDRRRDLGRRHRLHQAAGAGQASRSSAGSTRPACTPSRMCGRSMLRPERHDGQRICRRHDRARRPRRQAAEGARRPRHRQRHDRDLHDRQRPAHELLAGRRHTPFRSEKNTNWEGAFRVPCMVRWPGQIKPGSVSNEIVSGLDWFPTLARRGRRRRTSRSKLLKAATQAGGMTFKVHLDGYNQLPYLTGQQPKSAAQGVLLLQRRRRPRRACATKLEARVLEQRAQGTLQIWAEPSPAARCRRCSTCARTPTSAPTSRRTPTTTGLSAVVSWRSPAQAMVAQFLETFKEFPPRQRPRASASIRSMEKLKRPHVG